ncbi:MAG: phosphoribosylanthranilate isomerase, partial [Alphaproteobacteria bacterium]|nr:phosphoribosylanthranilate isomerase [Alphaproteobacteria bacterium]
MSVAVKICGLTDREALHASIEAGASFLGFVFVPKSKRYITPEQARDLLATLPHPALCRFQTAVSGIEQTEVLVLTALFVDASDKDIQAVCDALAPFLGLIQLHGNETPERVAEIKARTGLPVMKAIPIATTEDFACVKDYEAVADMLLFDTKVGKGSSGGT